MIAYIKGLAKPYTNHKRTKVSSRQHVTLCPRIQQQKLELLQQNVC